MSDSTILINQNILITVRYKNTFHILCNWQFCKFLYRTVTHESDSESGIFLISVWKISVCAILFVIVIFDSDKICPDFHSSGVVWLDWRRTNETLPVFSFPCNGSKSELPSSQNIPFDTVDTAWSEKVGSSRFPVFQIFRSAECGFGAALRQKGGRYWFYIIPSRIHKTLFISFQTNLITARLQKQTNFSLRLIDLLPAA